MKNLIEFAANSLKTLLLQTLLKGFRHLRVFTHKPYEIYFYQTEILKEVKLSV